jgi:hypothetical protein
MAGYVIMNISKIRILLMGFCCVSRVPGKLYIGKGEVAGDHHVASLLGIPVEEWLNLKPEVLKEYFEESDDALIGINQDFLEKLKTAANVVENAHLPEIQKKIAKIQEKFDNKLQPHQVLIEHYKVMRGFDTFADWNKLYFSRSSRIARNVIKKIGLETAIAVLEWMKERYPSYNLRGIMESYQYYWKDIHSRAEMEEAVADANSAEYD